MTKVEVEDDRLVIEDLECRDQDTVGFFVDIPGPSRPELVCKALGVGVVGLRAMGVAGQVELVEREFLKLAHQFDAALAGAEGELLARVQATFDPDEAESVSGRLRSTITAAHQAAGQVVTDAREKLERLITDSFNPDLATSCVYRIAKLMADTRGELDRAFDPAYEGSHLSTLTKMVDAYFGPDGTVADVVARQVGPVKAELLEALQGVRELIVGHAMAAEERAKAPASGFDFEDEVEALLCRMAAAYGDTVERVGAQSGEAGRSKCGDFVVQLPNECRFVVEAKKRTSPLPLRGDRGVLALLKGSMVNRKASFSIAVAPDGAAFAKEVGSFNDYDGDKLLCRFGQGGELLEAAYRWARAALLAGAAQADGLDINMVEAAIEEARRALRELSRIEGKAKSIAHTADEIQGLVSFQVRRLNAALDQAAAGLDYRQQVAS
jgi:hypothetical protein